MDAFDILGLSRNATEQQVRQAYHQKVKACHPDQFIDVQDQQLAQDQLIQLNLAYEQALRLTMKRLMPPTRPISAEEAKAMAKKLLEERRYESALAQLTHAETRDDEWYYLHGQLLMGIHQYSTAHQSFREALRLQPENRAYRQSALDAAVAVKKHQRWTRRMAEWAGACLRRHQRRGS